MGKSNQRHFDICTELCPTSSVAMIGAGLIALTLGDLQVAGAIILTGVAVGVCTPPKHVVRHRVTIDRRRRF